MRLFAFRFKHFIYRNVNLVPILMLVYDLLFTVINSEDYYYTLLSYNAFGWSIATNIVFICFFSWSGKKFCEFTKICVYGLSLLTLIDCIGIFLEDFILYRLIYTILITSVCFLLGIIYLLRGK
tara:strand:- start:4121 stop:4492 length:372 start_codon:yes stop_codon:yes gene_type:complete